MRALVWMVAAALGEHRDESREFVVQGLEAPGGDAPVLVQIPRGDLPSGLKDGPFVLEQVLPEGASRVAWQADPEAFGGAGGLVFQHSGPSTSARYRIRRVEPEEAGFEEARPAGRRTSRGWRLSTPEGEGRTWISRGEADDGSPRGIAFCEGDQLAEGLEPRWKRSGYVFPLHGPGGVDVLADFPADHRHHRGISWMWPRVYPGEGADPVDLWTLEGIRTECRGGRSAAGPVFGRIQRETDWWVAERRIVAETLRLTAYDSSREGAEGAGCYDFELSWQARAEGVALAGQTTQNKGYGGFLVRMAAAEDVRLHSPRGDEPRELLHEPFPWTALSGVIEGREISLIVLSHPDNPGHPNPWLMRFQGYVGESWPGLEPEPIPRERPIEARFRVLVEPGRPDTDWIGQQYELFASPPTVRWETK